MAAHRRDVMDRTGPNGWQTISDCVNTLVEKAGAADVVSTLDVLLKCVSNILNYPDNPKYRRLKVGSRDVKERLLPVQGAIECLFVVGFQKEADHFILPSDSSLEPLRYLRQSLNNKRSELLRQLPKKPSTSEVVGAMDHQQRDSNRGWDSKRYPRDVKSWEGTFRIKVTEACTLVSDYEDPLAQQKAKSCIPINELNRNAQLHYESVAKGRISPQIKGKPMDTRDCLLLELMFWFKNSFFKWFDAPDCPRCAVPMEGVPGKVSPTAEELKFCAQRVEMYRCNACAQEARFPRYNDPMRLLDTRKGRCGEWANCFTLCCRALGFDARYVLDWTDHVWTEVFSASQNRWLHCDPCENLCDAPLVYETGWGKRLTYVLAFSRDDVQDVTWRYSADHGSLLERRVICRESWLLDLVMRLRCMLQLNVDAERRKRLAERSALEVAEFLCPRNAAAESEKGGRQSGGLAWRQQRGEMGAGIDADEGSSDSFQATVFELSTEEAVSKRFRLKYCTATDRYVRDSAGHAEMGGWHTPLFRMEHVFRKVERDWKMAYLARTVGADQGLVAWKFDCSKTNLKVDVITVKFLCTTFESGLVIVTLCAGDKCLRVPGGGQPFVTSEFRGEQQFILSAELSGGHGDVSWQHAQLFRQPLQDKNTFPFDLSIKFE